MLCADWNPWRVMAALWVRETPARNQPGNRHPHAVLAQSQTPGNLAFAGKAESAPQGGLYERKHL